MNAQEDFKAPTPPVGRTWVPEHFLDEITPPGRATPEAWLTEIPNAKGRYRIEQRWPDDENPDGFDVAVGDLVGFLACDDHGSVEVQIKRDGTYSVTGGVSASATHFCCLGDVDTLADSMEEFVKLYVDNWPHDSDAETETVCMATWSKIVRFRLLLEDGKPRFRQASVN